MRAAIADYSGPTRCEGQKMLDLLRVKVWLKSRNIDDSHIQGDFAG
jgi:hypothetical protein